MGKRHGKTPAVNIGQLNIKIVLRDLVHQRGDAPVKINKAEIGMVGGDGINASSAPARCPRRKAKKAPRKAVARRAAKLITHAAIITLGGLVSLASAGVAFALGWT